MNCAFLALGLALLAMPLQEQHIGRALSLSFENTGAQTPQTELPLELAAQTLAHEALLFGLEYASAMHNVLRASSQAGAFDAMPYAYFFLGDSPEQLLQTAQLRLAGLHLQPAPSHMGAGLASHGAQYALCVLLVERKGLLSLPKIEWGKPLARKKKLPVCVQLYGRRSLPRLLVQTPHNNIHQTPMQPQKGKWCAELSFPLSGRYTVEVLSHSERGPQITHLFFVQTAQELPPLPRPAFLEPYASRTPGFSYSKYPIYDAINRLRLDAALPLLRVNAKLETLAQQYALQMREEAFFAHVDPQGHGLLQRLEKAKLKCQEASENLGSAQNPWAAHRAIEHSPAHRAALLNKRFQHMGIGFISNPDGKTYLVEVFCN